ncbi:aspartate/glutamate racemase family protein [Candidatus Bipolaricaulota bacterium]|nr:aspartate/glutamate racemase family protein [Candidatus Bipolaricaulota bacterium]
MPIELHVIIPVSTDRWNEGVRQLCQAAADRDTAVNVVHLAHGPESIECTYDETLVAPYVIEAAAAAERAGADGVIVYCFGNPAVDGAREAVSIPVVGLGEAAEVAALLLGDRFGIISTIPEAVPRLWRKARTLGVEGRLVGVVPLGIPVLGLGDHRRAVEAGLAAGRELVARGAQVVILGCGSLLGVADELRRGLGIPVVVPAVAAVKLAEAYVKMGIAHSKAAYPPPPPKIWR